jgi:outer membrane protein assembly factor BamB
MAYDLATGAERWWVGGLPACGKSTPVIGKDLVYVAASDIILEPTAEKRNPDRAAQFYANNKARTMAVQPGSAGEVPPKNILWSEQRGTPGVPSLLYFNGLLYSFKDGGLIFCRDAQTGSLLYSERLETPGYYYSSPVTADNKIYIASAEGVVVVLETGAKFKKLAANKLDGAILATPALADRNIYVRTQAHLYSFEN